MTTSCWYGKAKRRITHRALEGIDRDDRPSVLPFIEEPNTAPPERPITERPKQHANSATCMIKLVAQLSLSRLRHSLFRSRRASFKHATERLEPA